MLSHTECKRAGLVRCKHLAALLWGQPLLGFSCLRDHAVYDSTVGVGRRGRGVAAPGPAGMGTARGTARGWGSRHPRVTRGRLAAARGLPACPAVQAGRPGARVPAEPRAAPPPPGASRPPEGRERGGTELGRPSSWRAFKAME